MKELTQAVQDKADEKWSFRAKSRQGAANWYVIRGREACSFCKHYTFISLKPCPKTECICPLQDFNSLCCNELEEISKMFRKYYVSYPLRTIKLKRFNELCEAVQNRIRSLKVGE